MAVTDLLTKIPFPPSGNENAPSDDVPPAGDGVPHTFEIELPTGAPAPAPTKAYATEASGPVGDGAATAPPDHPARAMGPAAPSLIQSYVLPLPSYAIALIGGLSLVCLALTVALVAALSATPEPAPLAASAAAADAAVESAPAPVPTPEPTPAPTASATPAAFPAEPAPIPVDLITRLEEASDEPLDVELTRLLDAIQHGFGTQSARLEPTLRSYVYRMSSRFEWNPNSFRVAVTAPTPDLAAARAALLSDLFEEAVASGRLQVGHGTGSHSLTLVSE